MNATQPRKMPRALRLSGGAHSPPADGLKDACLLELTAWLAGEPWSYRPKCTSPVLASCGITLNDRLLGEGRYQRKDLEPRLRKLAKRLIGTAGRPDVDQKAGLMAHVDIGALLAALSEP